MAFRYSIAVRDAGLDARQSAVGASPLLKFFSGAEPASCAAVDPAGLLGTMILPSTWMAPASGGRKEKRGTWSGRASAGGAIASWRIYDHTGMACHHQGNTTDMVFDNIKVKVGQVVTVKSYTLTAGNS